MPIVESMARWTPIVQDVEHSLAVLKCGHLDFNCWWCVMRTSSKWGKICGFQSNLTLKLLVNAPQSNRYFNQGLLHLWWSQLKWLMSYHMDKLLTDEHKDSHTRTGNNNTRRPKLAWSEMLKKNSLTLKITMLGIDGCCCFVLLSMRCCRHKVIND